MHVPQLLNPRFYILPFGIIVERLLHGVEHPCFARIIAYSGIVLPVAPIATDIVVDEQALVPLSADAPIDAEVFGKEAGDILSQSIGGVAREEELAHTGIDEAIPRPTLEKTLHGGLGFGVFRRGKFPRIIVVGLEAGDAEEAVPKLTRCETEVVPPEKLEAHGGGTFIFAFGVTRYTFSKVSGAVLEGEEVGVDLASRDAAQCEPGGKLGAEVFTEGAIAGVFIASHTAACDEMFDTVVAGGFAAFKWVRRGDGAGHGRRLSETKGGGEGFVEGGDKV